MPIKLTGESLVRAQRERAELVYRELKAAGYAGVTHAQLRTVVGSADVIGPTIIWLRSKGVGIIARAGSGGMTEYVLDSPMPGAWESAESRVAEKVGEKMRLELGTTPPEPGSIGPRRPRARPPELPGQTSVDEALS